MEDRKKPAVLVGNAGFYLWSIKNSQNWENSLKILVSRNLAEAGKSGSLSGPSYVPLIRNFGGHPFKFNTRIIIKDGGATRSSEQSEERRVVGVPGLEPGASRSQSERSSQLNYTPLLVVIRILADCLKYFNSKQIKLVFASFICWCREAESNCRHVDFQSTALPLSYLGSIEEYPCLNYSNVAKEWPRHP